MKAMLAPPSADALRRREDLTLREEVEPWIEASVEDHARALVSVVRFADAAIAGSPLGLRLREWQDPRSAEAEAAWLRLVRQYRARRVEP